jgi:hypothetical protein
MIPPRHRTGKTVGTRGWDSPKPGTVCSAALPGRVTSEGIPQGEVTCPRNRGISLREWQESGNLSRRINRKSDEQASGEAENRAELSNFHPAIRRGKWFGHLDGTHAQPSQPLLQSYFSQPK